MPSWPRTAWKRFETIRKAKVHTLSWAFRVLIFWCVVMQLEAAVPTITPATGGGSISADTTGGAYTSITGPVYTEGASGHVGTGTFVLNAPAGFVFDTGGVAPVVICDRVQGGLFAQ